MKTRASLKNRQGGAVAVMVGFSIVLLVGFLAMVIDLGHLYIAKTELQNGADAAALAGAKELVGSKLGVQNAITAAVAVARKNNFDLQNKPVGTQATEGGLIISVGSCPGDTGCNWMLASAVDTEAKAADKTFLKVDTRDPNIDRRLDTWFAPVWGILKTGTYGMAVAGRYTIQVSPLGVCAIDVALGTQPGSCSVPTVNSCNGANVKDCGFLRGVAYNIPDLNPLNNGDPIWINPVDAVSSGTCSPSNGSTTVLAPFVCSGKSTVITSLPGCVWVNTGTQSVMSNPLNSRFGDYSGGQHCDDPATAPPDTNVQEYICTQQNTAQTSTFAPGLIVPASPSGVDDNRCLNNPPADTSPRNWMQPTVAPVNDPLNNIPTRQGIEMNSATRKPFNYPDTIRLHPEIAADFARYGVLWSYSREVSDFSTNPFTSYAVSDWCRSGLLPSNPLCPTGPGTEAGLYGGQAAPAYPTANPAPYFDPAFSTAPTGSGAAFATANRRVLNIAIIDCSATPSIAGQSCSQQLPVLAIGKFFMQRKADLPHRVYGEFVGLAAPPLPPAEIRLYR